MLGLLLIIIIYAALGFTYAWITGIIAREEISVNTGVVVVLLPGIASIALSVAQVEIGLFALALDFVLLVLGGKFIAKVEWKPAAVIAIVYSLLLFLVGFGLVLLAS